jgi:large subunit ribosomal protein L2
MLKFIKPTTPSQRQLIKLSSQNLGKKAFLKKEIKSLKKNSAGKNNSGKITVKHRGGGHKKKYRKIRFFRPNNSIGITCSLEYDPYRKANVASIFEFISNKFFYIIAPKKLKIGDIVKSGENAEMRTGHSLPLSKIPIGSYIHNISTKNQGCGQISRAAGTFSRITEKTSEHVKIKISSGEQRLLFLDCYATVGIVSNELVCLTTVGKAGRSRWLNKRPKVRGVAMNPVDHPHGGGEGKKSGKGLNYWGKPIKGGKTSKTTNKFVIKKND